jgi:hypothetical protein
MVFTTALHPIPAMNLCKLVPSHSMTELAGGAQKNRFGIKILDPTG